MRRGLLATFLAAATFVVVALPASAASTTGSDKVRARTGMLVLSDFPSGWTQGKRASTSDAKLEAAASKITSCKPFIAFSKANLSNPRVMSPNFEQGQSSVSNAVSIYPSTARATAAMHLFADERLPTCLENLFTPVFKAQLAKTKSVAKQVESITTKIAPISGIRIGDEAVVYQGTVDVALKNGTSEKIGIGFVSVRVGDAIDGYSYTSDTDISAALQPAIVRSVTRLQNAQSAG